MKSVKFRSPAHFFALSSIKQKIMSRQSFHTLLAFNAIVKYILQMDAKCGRLNCTKKLTQQDLDRIEKGFKLFKKCSIIKRFKKKRSKFAAVFFEKIAN
mmetsp:Transcript_53636/g.61487  ORF Transcript_53636/g.61487 Transcript_53636/m.61487 type:complete len:99 (-) Transcript_53636:1610-1906(-)